MLRVSNSLNVSEWQAKLPSQSNHSMQRTIPCYIATHKEIWTKHKTFFTLSKILSFNKHNVNVHFLDSLLHGPIRACRSGPIRDQGLQCLFEPLLMPDTSIKEGIGNSVSSAAVFYSSKPTSSMASYNGSPTVMAEVMKEYYNRVKHHSGTASHAHRHPCWRCDVCEGDLPVYASAAHTVYTDDNTFTCVYCHVRVLDNYFRRSKHTFKCPIYKVVILAAWPQCTCC